jgi:creatinine amidohydrolase/Fe(II)-dependent formamide hydrolase-like protein
VESGTNFGTKFQRINRTSARTSASIHFRSAVNAGTPRHSASERQARSASANHKRWVDRTPARGGGPAVSPNGVLGDPTRASAAAGHTLLDAAAADLRAALLAMPPADL